MSHRGRAAASALVCAFLVAGCGGAREVRPEPAPPPAPVAVPRLIGLPADEAQLVVQRLGLRWRWAESAQPMPANAFNLPDPIYAQLPAPGTNVARGSVVVLVPHSTGATSRVL